MACNLHPHACKGRLLGTSPPWTCQCSTIQLSQNIIQCHTETFLQGPLHLDTFHQAPQAPLPQAPLPRAPTYLDTSLPDTFHQDTFHRGPIISEEGTPCPHSTPDPCLTSPEGHPPGAWGLAASHTGTHTCSNPYTRPPHRTGRVLALSHGQLHLKLHQE